MMGRHMHRRMSASLLEQPDPTMLRVVVTTFAGLAVLSTVFRLWHRRRFHQLWADDAWVTVSVLAQIVLLVNLWIRTDTPASGPLHQSRKTRVVAYWIVSLCFTFTLWSARMSQLFSIIRLIPFVSQMRRRTYALVGLFGAMGTALVVQKVVICRRDTSWYSTPSPQCHLGRTVAITELCTDFVSDAVLVLVPIRLAWKVTAMQKKERRLLFGVFSASVATTAVSAVHAGFVLGPSGLLEAITANVEASVSLMVANVAVIVSFVYRLQKGSAKGSSPNNPYGLRGSMDWQYDRDGKSGARQGGTPKPVHGKVGADPARLRFGEESEEIVLDTLDGVEGSKTMFSEMFDAEVGIRPKSANYGGGVLVTKDVHVKTDETDPPSEPRLSF